MTLWESLKQWRGSVEINNEKFNSLVECEKTLSDEHLHIDSIVLHAKHEIATEREIDSPVIDRGELYRITVRQYMTRKATPDFNFMVTWNNNNPMPLRTMVGTIERETSGMVYMKLYGDVDGSQVQRCLKCGAPITNPVSKLFGMGPECGSHQYINPFETEEELKIAVDDYRRNYLNRITWEGWIIKSAIIEKEILK
jgi:hypothetical protein